MLRINDMSKVDCLVKLFLRKVGREFQYELCHPTILSEVYQLAKKRHRHGLSLALNATLARKPRLRQSF